LTGQQRKKGNPESQIFNGKAHRWIVVWLYVRNVVRVLAIWCAY
jgi:hypothetical protein